MSIFLGKRYKVRLKKLGDINNSLWTTMEEKVSARLT